MRVTNYKTRLLGFFLLLGAMLLSSSGQATHLRAGEITVQRLSCTSLTFRITITVYTNTGSDIKFGEGLLDFGDGSDPHVTPIVENTLRPDLGPQVATVSYSINHTYSGPSKYTISYLEPNRNAGILNMVNSVETRFYLETVINIDPFLGCSNTPLLLVPPIDKACTGAAWFHNPGAFDPDGDSVSFEFAIPKKEKGQFVNGYRDPNAREFYSLTGINYAMANEKQDGPPTFTINSKTGTIIWDAPGAPGEYNIAFLIKEWRKIQGAWVLLGYVTRDMQIIVEDCDNRRPELDVPPDICVEAGTIINQDIFGSDPDLDSVKIEAFSQLFGISPSPATFSPSPPKFQSTKPPNQAKLAFSWETKCEHIKDQPYQVVFKITDKSKSGPSLVSFQTWNIRVVGPAPTWVDAQVDLGNRHADLQWDPYTCVNAEKIQIWRRVDQFSFTPPECVTGMPNLGYTKIAEVPSSVSSFKDTNGGKGLAPGAVYCYRLVATFPFPGGGESYVSDEICLPPILADAPVITNVTIDRTSTADGLITVKWRPPFDVDKVQFPPPYSYQVLRAQGFTSTQQTVTPHPGQLSDTTFVDSALNTEENVYNYRIIAFDANNTRIDTSAIASSVRLEAASEFKQISLAWTANVPWSNQTQDYPMHLIFRGPAGSTESQLVLIDSVNVTENQFNYTDAGQFNGVPLVDTDVYCYRVMTRGAYGNPKIAEPLRNFSQIICAQPNDNVPPCTPVPVIVANNCDEFFRSNSCEPQTFSNTLQWLRPEDPVCRADIRSYNIYKANRKGDAFEPYVTNVRDTFFVDDNLPSFARCYKITAVDRSGNESEMSEEFCFDNCPYYELPNVFSPNGDCQNPKFSAFGDVKLDENLIDPCGSQRVIVDIRTRCARFVEKVNFTVFDRWGKEMYNYESGGERTIYINWDGKDSGGIEVPGGVYFYSADVVFDVVDPAKKNKTFKGWVHLLR